MHTAQAKREPGSEPTCTLPAKLEATPPPLLSSLAMTIARCEIAIQCRSSAPAQGALSCVTFGGLNPPPSYRAQSGTSSSPHSAHKRKGRAPLTLLLQRMQSRTSIMYWPTVRIFFRSPPILLLRSANQSATQNLNTQPARVSLHARPHRGPSSNWSPHSGLCEQQSVQTLGHERRQSMREAPPQSRTGSR